MTVTAASFLCSVASIRAPDIIRRRIFAIDNAGPVSWWDILTPLTLLDLLFLR
jgi:hypothetical protein